MWFQVSSTNTSHTAANELICGDGKLSETLSGKKRVALLRYLHEAKAAPPRLH